MNRATLQERIKEEIVVRRGQVKDRQWRQTGLPDEAAREGIEAEEFRRLVNEVSRQVNFEKLADLHRRIEDALMAPPQFEMHQTQQDEFVTEAERMGLSAPFVRDRWLPLIITDLKKAAPATPAPTDPAGSVAEVTPPPISPPAPPVAPVVPAENPRVEAQSAPPERVKAILDEYNGHISARDLRLLFRAMPTDERTLAEEILAYLSANFYASVTEPTGATLAEKLLSTDWRHLSHWDTPPEPEPVPTPAYVPLATPEPAYTPPPPYNPAPVPSQPEQESGGNAGLWGAVFAVAVLLILYFLIKPNQNKNDKPEREPERTEQTGESRRSDRPSRAERNRLRREREAANETAPSETVASDDRSREPVAESQSTPISDAPPVVEPPKKYDRLLETTGQFGERPAKLGRRWGLWRNNDWMILPIYDDITTFRDGRATVVLKGRTYDIDEQGNPIEE